MIISKALSANRMSKTVVAVLLVTQLTACGTILYPERRGQTNGQIDVGVVALNAIGLLFFVVPGVVAFGVDFITGAIYLPGGGIATLTADEIDNIKATPDSIDVEKFKKVMAQRDDIQLPESVYTDQLITQNMSSQQALQTAMNLSSENISYALR
ncbi:Polyribonucleotide nucleotidyltransferase (polynucleotide phosphorylase) [Marinomonas ushuaiensis DSM 15871]|uniref:Polyribonucleotide nucleotidyltransferase (Polynucleotide phosphorylase) n=1 Tax=Marinomonas ushuaiensis DSM 15871 TaxID=1122207 RepID=X7E511_9GAMM|nr:hypothetical protein [Marinomonas ushuaiensis]ETX10261.1 Polyribonucleotide nucleotidyltransferase (polynucleotide phosphorylase) [Marinomonas ushuaiensis DSM 15871]